MLKAYIQNTVVLIFEK